MYSMKLLKLVFSGSFSLVLLVGRRQKSTLERDKNIFWACHLEEDGMIVATTNFVLVPRKKTETMKRRLPNSNRRNVPHSATTLQRFGQIGTQYSCKCSQAIRILLFDLCDCSCDASRMFFQSPVMSGTHHVRCAIVTR